MPPCGTSFQQGDGHSVIDKTRQKKNNQRKKIHTFVVYQCLSWADTEKPQKSTMCSKDSPDSGQIRKESEEKEEGEKRHSLSN